MAAGFSRSTGPGNVSDPNFGPLLPSRHRTWKLCIPLNVGFHGIKLEAHSLTLSLSQVNLHYQFWERLLADSHYDPGRQHQLVSPCIIELARFRGSREVTDDALFRCLFSAAATFPIFRETTRFCSYRFRTLRYVLITQI